MIEYFKHLRSMLNSPDPKIRELAKEQRRSAILVLAQTALSVFLLSWSILHLLGWL
jgi:hypothetical protein